VEGWKGRNGLADMYIQTTPIEREETSLRRKEEIKAVWGLSKKKKACSVGQAMQRSDRRMEGVHTGGCFWRTTTGANMELENEKENIKLNNKEEGKGYSAAKRPMAPKRTIQKHSDPRDTTPKSLARRAKGVDDKNGVFSRQGTTGL